MTLRLAMHCEACTRALSTTEARRHALARFALAPCTATSRVPLIDRSPSGHASQPHVHTSPVSGVPHHLGACREAIGMKDKELSQPAPKRGLSNGRPFQVCCLCLVLRCTRCSWAHPELELACSPRTEEPTRKSASFAIGEAVSSACWYTRIVAHSIHPVRGI